MRIRNKIEIPEKDAFKNCKLDRKKYAIDLTQIIKTYKEGFVLALDAEWGTGKTTFIEMWRQYLNNEGFTTGYFNAWESDYEISPMGAILAEIKQILPTKEKSFDNVITKAGVIAQKILPAVGKTLAKKYLGENFEDVVGGATEASTEILKEEIERYTKRQKGIIEFRKAIEEYLKSKDTNLPIVFFVDELDRCRPNYSVEILEQIKHFFEVPGIVFVLSIDKTQLSNAIKGFYGSEHLDTEEYLRRFIDIECSLPKPNYRIFCGYLLTRYQLKDQGDYIYDFMSAFFENKRLTLRQQEKIIARIKLISDTAFYNEVSSSLISYLLIIYTFDRTLFINIRDRTITIQEIVNTLEKLIELNSDTINYIGDMTAILLHSYTKYCETKQYLKDKFLIKESTSIKYITINSKFFDLQKGSIIALIEKVDRNIDQTTLDVLIQKIQLLA